MRSQSSAAGEEYTVGAMASSPIPYCSAFSGGLQERSHVFLRQENALEIRVHHDMYALTLGQHLLIASAHDFVPEMQQRLADVNQPSTNGEQVVVAGRRLEAATHIHHRDVDVIVCLHVAIGEAKLSQHLHPTHFKPYEVVGVVHHAHLVGFRGAQAELGVEYLCGWLVVRRHELGIQLTMKPHCAVVRTIPRLRPIVFRSRLSHLLTSARWRWTRLVPLASRCWLVAYNCLPLAMVGFRHPPYFFSSEVATAAAASAPLCTNC